ncbi:hypothetical protein [Pseudoroseicyclus aestuarii]|uniref:Phage regulatory protein CII n=1 Tax=Pseudoroseicyclus aestuarii TaxID=1795041 RepID=A0A318SLK4_9RHOB|nr:hypothetical protein [Pseudoroseicyclus aestuarii]PYE80397.1 hypothetical protein DFP88_1167 [Pseudoroseicyclus aestuarii]
MSRNHPAGSVQDAVSRAYTAAGGLEAASDMLGLTASTLSEATAKSAKRPHGLGVNHLDRLARMSPEAARVLAEHFAAHAGGVFHPSGAGAAGADNLLAQIGVSSKEFGEAISAGMSAIQSGDPQAINRAIVEHDEAGAAIADQRALLVKLRETHGGAVASLAAHLQAGAR